MITPPRRGFGYFY